MSEKALMPNKQYDFKFSAKYCSGSIDEVIHRIDINSLAKIDATHLELNEIGPCRVKLTQQVAYDTYQENRKTGAFIIIDRMSNITIAAGMIKNVIHQADGELDNKEHSEFELEFNALVRKHFPSWEAVDISKGFKK
jgi:sulfate adenylyltransferase subunit 1